MAATMATAMATAMARRAGARAARRGASGGRRALSGSGEAGRAAAAKAWESPLGEAEWEELRELIAAPSPVGLEGAMAGTVERMLRGNVPAEWKVHRFRGSAGLVLDTAPEAEEDRLNCMVVGHTDKIRMQVRKVVGGKVYVDCDSHLPLTLLGNPVVIFSEDAAKPGAYRALRGGTVEALGAIHFSEPSMRAGKAGIKADKLYVELQLHGDDVKEQVERLGLRPGDSIIMDRPIQRGVGANTFQGAYLDNGLGCYIAARAARMAAAALSENPRALDGVRVLFAFATHEEIGRFGSRVLAQHFRPDAMIAVDVNHDYNAAPGVAARNLPDIGMGSGPTLSVGSVASPNLNAIVQRAAAEAGIPLQIDVVGRDTGTDAMAGVLANLDCASTSIGVPIRNMHTISETACSTDVLAATHLVHETLLRMGKEGPAALPFSHPDLTAAEPLTLQ